MSFSARRRFVPILLAAALAGILCLAGCAAGPAPTEHADGDTALPHARGLDVTASPYDTAETVRRFKAVARNHGLHIFDTIDHAAGAQRAGLTLPPTTLVIFGNPKAGTPLMQCQRTVAIDLPSKALIWTDRAGQTWLAVNDIDALARRHHMTDCPNLDQVQAMMQTLVSQTVLVP